MSILQNPDNVIFGQYERTEELNERYNQRLHTNAKVEYQFGARPVETRYVKFGTVDQRYSALAPTKIYSGVMYDPKTHFLPSQAQGPWTTFASNVDVETVLRNQVYALQKSEQSSYVPSSSSDLYNTIITTDLSIVQPHPGLFEKSELFTSQTASKGNQLFNNDSRQSRLNQTISFR